MVKKQNLMGAINERNKGSRVFRMEKCCVLVGVLGKAGGA